MYYLCPYTHPVAVTISIEGMCGNEFHTIHSSYSGLACGGHKYVQTFEFSLIVDNTFLRKQKNLFNMATHAFTIHVCLGET